MIIKCALEGCDVEFDSKNGKKFCCHRHCKKAYYEQNKYLSGNPKGRPKDPSPIHYVLCNKCKTPTKLIYCNINKGMGDKYHVKVGRLCITCKTVSIDPRYEVLDTRVPVMVRTA